MMVEILYLASATLILTIASLFLIGVIIIFIIKMLKKIIKQ
jgi:hypothetical protein